MKRTFFQTNIFFQFFVFIFFVGFIVYQGLTFKILYLIISFVKIHDYSSLLERILVLLLCELMSVILFRVFLRFEHNNIHIKKGKIYMNDDWLRKKEKIQYRSEVFISDIQSIDIIWTSKNSLNGHIDGRTLGSIAPKAYISFKKNSGEIVNMFILYMNHRTVSKMIDCIKEEMKKNNNLNHIEDTIYLTNKFTKKLDLK